MPYNCIDWKSIKISKFSYCVYFVILYYYFLVVYFSYVLFLRLQRRRGLLVTRYFCCY